jgi:uncharacterized membrane-anchored protein YjiN (DUF445 family)
MKIEIDLDDIFRDEDGNPEESLQESIRRQVIDKFSVDLSKRLFERMDRELSEIMRDQIDKVMSEKMPELIDDIMNVTYTPVSTYGARGEPTTFRAEIVRAVGENMKYQPKQYQSEENAFTKAVRSIVDQKTSAIQAEITKQVDVKFKEDAISFAVKKLSERLGLDKK